MLAAFLGIVIYNLNVTSQGAPLNGVGGAPGPASAGITDGARTAFYVALAVTGAVLTVGGFALIVAERRWRSAGALASRSFAGLTAVGWPDGCSTTGTGRSAGCISRSMC